jgi:adenine phosphoribosyltransferase
MTFEKTIQALLRDVPDFPKPGIIFKDITPLLAAPGTRRKVVKAIGKQL